MKVSETPISGMFEILTDVRRDQRGSFARLFCTDDLSPALRERPIVQINHSMTLSVGAIRGLHFQRPPKSETKIVRCLKGRVYDVAVDLRHGSSTFLRWHAIELDAERMNAVLIPEGCAHGFQALEPASELLYLHSASYSPSHEAGVRFDDPRLEIVWPLPVTDISDRDMSHPPMACDFEGIAL